ncbi:MAG: ABC transporter permease [Bdellovibrionaceae bacterium]|nr:ABC transporter permease [Pseudobdellovibrionaceae bacterium]
MVAFWTLFKKEVKRFLKVMMQTIVTPFMSSFLYLLVFGVSLGAKMNDVYAVSYLAFLIPGLMMMGLMNNAFQNSSSSIAVMKFSGDLEDIRVTPLSSHHILMAMGMGSVIRGLAVAVVTYIVGVIFYFVQFNEFLGISHPFVLAYFVLVGGFIFGLLGICAGFWAKSVEHVAAFTNFILLPLLYLGGVFVSIETLPNWAKTLSAYNPVLYLINGMRYGVLGIADVGLMHSIVVSAIGLVVLYGLAFVALKKANFSRW